MKFQIEVIKSKIHRVSVTQANLNYVGSITIDEALLVAVGDVVIIASYALMDFEEAKQFKPWVIFPDTETNRLIG